MTFARCSYHKAYSIVWRLDSTFMLRSTFCPSFISLLLSQPHFVAFFPRRSSSPFLSFLPCVFHSLPVLPRLGNFLSHTDYYGDCHHLWIILLSKPPLEVAKMHLCFKSLCAKPFSFWWHRMLDMNSQSLCSGYKAFQICLLVRRVSNWWTWGPWNMSSRSNFEKLRLAPHFGPALLCLVFMALGAQFTWNRTERVSHQVQF